MKECKRCKVKDHDVKMVYHNNSKVELGYYCYECLVVGVANANKKVKNEKI